MQDSDPAGLACGIARSAYADAQLRGTVSDGPVEPAQIPGSSAAGPHSRPLEVLLLPDAANRPGRQGNSFYYLSARPTLARTPQGDPMLSLTLELSRAPATTDSTILPLIRRAWLACTLTFGLSSEQQAAVEAAAGASCRPLFARSARVQLVSAGTVAASTDVAGAQAPVALSATLEREAALAVLAALDGVASGLQVTAEIHYRTAPSTTTLRLQGVYAEIYDAIAARCGAGGVIDRSTLQGVLEEMIHRRVLDATRVDAANVPPRRWTDLDALLSRFASAAAFILESQDGGSRFALRKRPNPLMHLDVSETVERAGDSRWHKAIDLETILGGALDGLERDDYIHLVTSAEGTGTVPVPRLVRSQRFRARPGATSHDPVRLAAAPAAYTSLALALTPDRSRAPTAHELLASDLVRTGGSRSRRLGIAGDFIIERLDAASVPAALPLAIVDRLGAPSGRPGERRAVVVRGGVDAGRARRER